MLEQARAGIICVTPDNQLEPWIHFEAGALSRLVNEGLVCPYLIGMQPADLAATPLAGFQAKVADRVGTLALIRTLNEALGDAARPRENLERAFDRFWPDLAHTLSNLPKAKSPARRPADAMTADILELVRDIARRMPDAVERRAPAEHVVPKALHEIRPWGGVGEDPTDRIHALIRQGEEDERIAEMVFHSLNSLMTSDQLLERIRRARATYVVRGTVVEVNPDRGFGFIRPEIGEQVYFTADDVTPPLVFSQLAQGIEVEFEAIPTSSRSRRARHIRLR